MFAEAFNRLLQQNLPTTDSCTAANSISIRSPRRRGRAASAAREAKRLCGLQIDHQLELGRLFDRQVGRLRTLENLVDEAGGPTIKISNIGPVGQKEARLRQLSLEQRRLAADFLKPFLQSGRDS